MSYFDTDPRASADLLERATLNPTQLPSAGFFEGSAAATGKGLLQGVVAQPALLLADAATPALRPVAGAIDSLFGGTTANDWLTSEQRKTITAVRGLMPDENVGMLGNLGYGLTSTLPSAVAGTVAGGPAGGAAAAGSMAGYSSFRVAQEKGVDDLTAAGQGAIEGAAMAAGVFLPGSVGSSIAKSVGVGVAGNVGLGVVSRGAVGTLLERNGYAEMAKQYRAFDAEAIAVDAVLGGAFGVVGAVAHGGSAKVAPQPVVDAALASKAKQHVEVETAPGVPVNPAARAAHSKAFSKALDDLANDRPVDVSETGVADADFLPVKAEVQASVRAAVEDLAPLGKALDTVDELRARAVELGLEPPDEPIMPGRKLEATAERADPIDAAPAGRRAEVFVGERSEPVRFEVVEADSLTPAIAKADNQFRDRSRAASQLQITKIANDLQFGRLADSPTMTDGAPTLARTGEIIGGNGRVAAIRRAYEGGTAADYRAQLEARAAEFGATAEQVQGMKQPVLVRKFENDVNIRQAAILSNEGGGLRMSGLEQSKVDAERMPSLRDVEIPESGDLNATSLRPYLRDWLARMPTDEQAAMVAADGKLSTEGMLRMRNALLFKAYGDSPTLARLVESTDEAQRNVATALVRAAPKVAEARDLIAAGELHDLDLQPQLLQAVERYSDLRGSNMTVEEFVAQGDMFGTGVGGESIALMRFMEKNKRSAKALNEAITGYYDAVRAAGDPRQGSMLAAEPPTRAEILAHVLRDEPLPKSQDPLFSAADRPDAVAETAPSADTMVPFKEPNDAARQAIEHLGTRLAGVADFVLEPAREVPAGAARDLRAAGAIAERLFGKKLVVVNQPGRRLFNGLFSTSFPDMIFVDAQSSKPHMAVVGHEMLHAMRNDRPDLYAGLQRDMREILTGKNEYSDMINAKREAAGMARLSDDVITEEMIADTAGDQFTDAKFWEALKAQDEGRFTRIAKVVRDFILDTLIRLDGLMNRDRWRPFGSDKMIADLDRARQTLAKSFSEYSKGEALAPKVEDGERLSVATQIDQALEERPNLRVVASEDYPTSAALELERADNDMQRATEDGPGIEAAVACAQRG